jgi:hypothetical protein
MRARFLRLSLLGRVMVAVTVAVAISLVFTQAVPVLIVALGAAIFWLYIVVVADPMMRWRIGDNPGVSERGRWRDADI